MRDVIWAGALQQARLVRAGEVSPVELVNAYLERIERLDPTLNCYVTVAADQALEAAKAAEREVRESGELPLFHGVPISVKDMVETKGIRTTFSCRVLEHYVPDQDDHLVQKVREAGFIILGKTNTSEFGTVPFTESVLNGSCKNPWDTTRTPAGSSGGAAVSVAAGLAPVAHGTDGAGSIRAPASACGLFGVKPSRGRISSGPRLGEQWHGFSTHGSIGRTVEDTAALLDALQGYFVGDPYAAPAPERPFREEARRDPGRLRVAFTTESPGGTDVDPQMRPAVEATAELLEELGHEVIEAAPAWANESLRPAFVQLIAAGMAFLDPFPREQLEPLNRFLLEMAGGITSVQHMQALTQVHAVSREIQGFWKDHDVLLTPTLGMISPADGWVFADDDPAAQLVRSGWFLPFTPPANLTGQPAVSVPLHTSEEGLPLGVQLVGRYGDEATLIRLSAQLEEASPWAGRIPPLAARG